MTKLDKLIDAGFHADDFVTFEPKQLKKTIQKYAEYYAKQCLAIAAENATIKKEFTLGFGENPVYFIKEDELSNYNLSVSKESITNIELPEHD